MNIILSQHEKAVAKGLQDAAVNAVPAAATIVGGTAKFGLKVLWGVAKTAYTATKLTANAASEAIATYQTQGQAQQDTIKTKQSEVVDAEVVG